MKDKGAPKRSLCDSDTEPPFQPAADETIRFNSADLQQYAQKQRKGSLLVIDGLPADIGRHLVVDDTVVIGRGAPGLELRDGSISRLHAAVEQRDNTYVVQDMGSTNGTLLNGEKVVDTHDLRDSDQIRVGQTVLKFTLVDETEAGYLQRMDRLAGTDYLTGLPAKHRFDSLLQAAMRRADRAQKPLSLLMMDLDGLKAINDKFGHQMGAQTIRQVGQQLGRLIVGRGEACRFGGDEFCVYLTNQALEDALKTAEEICAMVRQMTVTVDGNSVNPAISIGVAERPQGMLSESELLKLADKALYRAKAAGRDQASK